LIKFPIPVLLSSQNPLEFQHNILKNSSIGSTGVPAEISIEFPKKFLQSHADASLGIPTAQFSMEFH
jgi:hypothetical protein